MKIGGGNTAGVTRSLLQPLRHHQHRQHDEEGVVHLWTMGLWQSLVLSLSCAMMVRFHMSCQHDYGHII
jgi:hypothetical protein